MFQVYQDQQPPKEKPVWLKLQPHPSGVELVTCDEHGNLDWHVLVIRHDGTLKLIGAIRHSAIQVDGTGRILLAD